MNVPPLNLQWITTPLALYGAIGLALIGSAALFLTAKVEIAIVRRGAQQTEELLATRIAELEQTVEQLRARVEQVGEGAAAAANSTTSGLNLNKRTQALRMHQRGESVTTIAAALRAPQSEIELLLKLQKALAGA